jgi:RND family efflux transporter MFP subunit
MKKKPVLVGGVLIAALLLLVIVVRMVGGDASASGDPRLDPPIVRLAAPAPVDGAERGFTGVIAARVQSDLGFRVPGKIVERFVDTGQEIKTGEPLMRIDEADLGFALTAKRNTVAAARAMVGQTRADAERYAKLLEEGWVPRQRYEQAKAAADAARAQLAAAEAEVKLAENAAAYAVLTSDVDGTVVETLGEPGQVVAAGQTVIRIAQSGPREAVVVLPETVRPEIDSVAEATLYGNEGERFTAHLRQLSDAADPLTRTYEARYALEGMPASAPLGATVTIRFASKTGEAEVQVPLGAILDDGQKTGVWVFDAASSTVHFKPVKLVRLTSEHAVISGLNTDDPIVALGAHLLHEGASVRTGPEGGSDE